MFTHMYTHQHIHEHTHTHTHLCILRSEFSTILWTRGRRSWVEGAPALAESRYFILIDYQKIQTAYRKIWSKLPVNLTPVCLLYYMCVLALIQCRWARAQRIPSACRVTSYSCCHQKPVNMFVFSKNRTFSTVCSTKILFVPQNTNPHSARTSPTPCSIDYTFLACMTAWAPPLCASTCVYMDHVRQCFAVCVFVFYSCFVFLFFTLFLRS